MAMTELPKASALEGKALKECQDMLKSLDFKDNPGRNHPDLLEAFVLALPETLQAAVAAAKLGAKVAKSRSVLHKTLQQFCEKIEQILSDPGCIPEDKLVILLRSISRAPELVQEFPALRKTIIKRVIIILSTSTLDEVRVVTLLAIYQLCTRYPSLLEAARKLMYQQYVKCCRTLSTHNLGQAALLLNGLVEIFSLQPAQGATFGVKCLRQLTSLIHQAIKRPDKEHIRKVLCWQVIALLRFWSRLLAIHCVAGKKSLFTPLLHPVSNIITSLLTFQVSPRYFAFHFHVVACALEITKSVGSFIPINSCLLKIIGHVAKQPLYKLENKRAAYDLVVIYKVPKAEAGTKGYLETVAEDALYYILRHLVDQSSSFTFPEHAEPIISTLRGILSKEPKMDKALKKQIEGHLMKITQQRKEIESLRVTGAVTPALIATKGPLVPESSQVLRGYFSNLEKVREAKRKMLSQKDEETEEASTSKTSLRKSSSAPKAKSAQKRNQVTPTADNPISKKARISLPETKIRSAAKKNRITKTGADEDVVEDFVLGE